MFPPACDPLESLFDEACDADATPVSSEKLSSNHINARLEERPLNSLRSRLNLEEDLTILAALHILRSRFKRRDVYDSPSSVMHFLRLQSQGLQHEVFGVMYLDTHHRLIDYEQLFRGTLAQASVYPREVTRQALAANAASVILHHNHPSGDCLPSPADEALTLTLRAALGLVDIRVLDHIITSDSGAVSMRLHYLLAEDLFERVLARSLDVVGG